MGHIANCDYIHPNKSHWQWEQDNKIILRKEGKNAS